MELEELVRRIQKTDLLNKNLSKQKLAGGFNSMFKGRGVVFDSVRKYVAGDDIRDINWNVTARFQETFINTYSEDKERLVWLLMDVSGSGIFGSKGKSKLDQQIEIAATIAYSAITDNDRVGIIFFSNKIECVLEPARGMTAFWRIARELINHNPGNSSTDIESVLHYFMKINKKSSILFIISDFLDDEYAPVLQMVAQKHELVAIRVYDELEKNFPAIGWLKFKDAEGNGEGWVNTGSQSYRQAYHDHFKKAESYFIDALEGTNAGSVMISTMDDPSDKLFHFSSKR
jgi:uncharacterized protein (DUF58 family)